MDHIEVKARLLNTNVLTLMKAARECGVSFRNGLTKAEIVGLCAAQRRMFDVWARVEKLEAQGPAQPDSPTQEPSASALPSSPLVTPPPAPSQDSPTQPAPAQSDPQALIAALRAAIGPQQIDEARVRAIFEEEFSGLELSDESIRAVVIEELSKLPQGTVIHLPNKPEPVKFDGAAHKQFPDLLVALQCSLHVMLTGPASSGKTFAAEMAAKALERVFYAQGAVSYAHELMGYMDAQGKYIKTNFRRAFEEGGVILLDEFDASAPESVLVVNAALANGFCAFPDGMIQKHPDFLCIIGANTDGSGATMQYSGRARLDGAFLDRFVIIQWEIDENIEKGKAKGQGEWLNAVRAIRAHMESTGVQDVGATVRAVDYGSTLLIAGMPREKVLTMTCRKGALAEQWEQVTRLPAVAEFLTGF